MINISRNLAAAVVWISFVWAAPARADAVTYWNDVTLQAATVGRPGPPGSFDIALVQLAVHDAVQSIEGTFEPYFYADPSRRALGSPQAAVAAAAHRALVLLYPGRESEFDALYEQYLAANGLAGDPGLDTGEAAARALHATHYRAAFAVAPFFGRSETGQWRSAAPMAFLYVAFSNPFTLRDPSQFRPAPPAPLTSGWYAREYDEVKAIGSSIAHPNSGTEIARFWSVNFVTQWNEAMRNVADRHVSNIGDSARLFALSSLAAADALIAVWDSKYYFNFWRPSTAIREGEGDGNSKTAGDTGWTPLIGDPPYPDYVSGANGLTGAYTGILQLFFGSDELTFTVRTTSPLVANAERHYSRISVAAQEVVDARIFLGIHFRFADVEGRRLGDRVAHWTFMKSLRPVEAD